MLENCPIDASPFCNCSQETEAFSWLVVQSLIHQTTWSTTYNKQTNYSVCYFYHIGVVGISLWHENYNNI